MFPVINKDVSILVSLLSVAVVCFFLYKENLKMKEDISLCKTFSIDLSNRIPPAVVPMPVQAPVVAHPPSPPPTSQDDLVTP